VCPPPTSAARVAAYGDSMPLAQTPMCAWLAASSSTIHVPQVSEGLLEGLRHVRDSGASLSAEAAGELKQLSGSLQAYMGSDDMKSFARCVGSCHADILGSYGRKPGLDGRHAALACQHRAEVI
jgi:hypothetical protein